MFGKVSDRGSFSSTRGLGGGLSNVPLLLLLLMVAMVGKASGASGLSLTLGFSPGLPQPQDCPRFLDDLEVKTFLFFNPIPLIKTFLLPHPFLAFLHGIFLDSIEVAPFSNPFALIKLFLRPILSSHFIFFARNLSENNLTEGLHEKSPRD